MDNRLNDEVEQRIRALCDEIAVAYEVDDELREELRGHIEDKILGYLNGEVALSEADAFMLAREHFGDRARLKELLSEVHHVEAQASLARRIAAGIVVMIGLQHATPVFKGLFLFVAGRLGLQAILPAAYASSAHTLLGIISGVLVLAFMWWILARWKGQLRRGEPLWLVRWRPSLLALGACGVVVSIPLVTLTDGVLEMWSGLDAVPESLWSPAIILGVVFAVPLAFFQILLWLWWCDDAPRRPGAMWRASLVWILITAMSALLGYEFLFVERANSAFAIAPVLVTVGDHALVMLPFLLKDPSLFVFTVLAALICSGVVTLIGWAVYEKVRGIPWLGFAAENLPGQSLRK